MRRAISMILLLALVIGLLPGISAPAQALDKNQPQPFGIYEASVQSKPMNLSGTDYNNAIMFTAYKNDPSRVVYNLKGRYETLTFWAGYHSGYLQNGTLEILDDNGIIYSTTIGYEDLAKQHTISVKGVSKLLFRISVNNYDNTHFGLGEILFSPSTADPTDPIRKSDDYYNVHQYQLQEAKVVTDTFSMGGYNYQNGYKLSAYKNRDCKILFNFKGNYKQMTFEIARILNDPTTNDTDSIFLTITADGDVLDDYNKRKLYWNDISLPVTLDLEGVRQVSISLTKDNYSYSHCGIGNVQLVSDGRVQGITLAASAVTLTPNNPDFYLNPQIYPSDAVNKNFTLSIDPTDVATLKDNTVYGRSAGTAVVTATTEDGGHTATCVISSELPEAKKVYRVYGANRYDTAFKAADRLKEELYIEKFDNVVVACGTDFADALAGSYLAAVKKAPILLVHRYQMDNVKNYIKANLNPGGTVYLLGGENAISANMEKGLDGFTVKRLAGSNRYDTNLMILEEAGVEDKDIIVCTGSNFADSLSASAVGLPILLVPPYLLPAQKDFLSHISGDIIIVGGESAVNKDVENALTAYGNVKRLAGANRYETSILVAKEFFDSPTSAVVAYALNFPDGLSGGPLAYAIGAPLILTVDAREPVASAYTNPQGIKRGYVLGGPGLISDEVVKKIFSMK